MKQLRNLGEVKRAPKCIYATYLWNSLDLFAMGHEGNFLVGIGG